MPCSLSATPVSRATRAAMRTSAHARSLSRPRLAVAGEHRIEVRAVAKIGAALAFDGGAPARTGRRPGGLTCGDGAGRERGAGGCERHQDCVAAVDRHCSPSFQADDVNCSPVRAGIQVGKPRSEGGDCPDMFRNWARPAPGCRLIGCYRLAAPPGSSETSTTSLVRIFTVMAWRPLVPICTVAACSGTSRVRPWSSASCAALRSLGEPISR